MKCLIPGMHKSMNLSQIFSLKRSSYYCSNAFIKQTLCQFCRVIHTSMMSPRKKRAQWDDSRDSFLVQGILQATHEGKKSHTGFKKEIFHDLAKQFNAKYNTKLHLTQVRTCMNTVDL